MLKSKKQTSFYFGLTLAGAIVLMSLISLVYTPYGYNAMDAGNKFSSPSLSHIMGTDNFGRDVFSRVMIGGRYTLAVALCTVIGASLIGITLGLVAGYLGGIVGDIIMRIMDALSSFPGLLLALVMVAFLRSGPFTLVIAMLIMFVPFFTRLIRSGTLKYKNADFVKQAQLVGVSHLRIIFVHIMPNLTSTYLSAATVGLSGAILSEAGLSYLGLGIQPPVPNWGRMLSESQAFLFNSPWAAIFPGIVIILTVVSFHFIGDGMESRD